MSNIRTCLAGLLLMIATSSSATSPPKEHSGFSPSARLIEAGKQYDACVRTAAREFSSAPDDTPLIVQKAENHCHSQLSQLQEQAQADIDGTSSSFGREVDLFVNQATAATRVSAFAEVGRFRHPPVEVR